MKLIGWESALKLKLKLKLKGNLAKLLRAEEKRDWRRGGGENGGSLTAEETKRTSSVLVIFGGEIADPSLVLEGLEGFTDSD